MTLISTPFSLLLLALIFSWSSFLSRFTANHYNNSLAFSTFAFFYINFFLFIQSDWHNLFHHHKIYFEGIVFIFCCSTLFSYRMSLKGLSTFAVYGFSLPAVLWIYCNRLSKKHFVSTSPVISTVLNQLLNPIFCLHLKWLVSSMWQVDHFLLFEKYFFTWFLGYTFSSFFLFSYSDWLPLFTLFCLFLLISSIVIFKSHQGLILNYTLLFTCSHFLKKYHQVLGLQSSKWLSLSCTSVLNCWLTYPTWHFHLNF